MKSFDFECDLWDADEYYESDGEENFRYSFALQAKMWEKSFFLNFFENSSSRSMIETVEGSIEIDGRCIHDVDLAELRSSISIIPQEPVIFSGTMR